jgi:hypothetical protein
MFGDLADDFDGAVLPVGGRDEQSSRQQPACRAMALPSARQ